MKNITFYTFLFALFTLTACVTIEFYEEGSYYTTPDYETLKKVLDVPNEAIDYQIKLPAHTNGAAPFVSNDLSLLGRVLFYDKNLSKNRTISCASCHRQEIAFSDDKAFSTGFDGQLMSRNSLALGTTLGFENSYEIQSFANNKPAGFLWDERAADIHTQSKIALLDAAEMGMPHMQEVIKRVSQQAYYQVLFKKAFGDDEIVEWKVLKGIEAFVNSLASTNARFDEGMNKVRNLEKDFPNFSQMENLGKQLYQANCGSCHGMQMVGLVENVANNGLDLSYADVGRQNITAHKQDEGIFKVPMLRNIALTAPYMHDGRFSTLESVVEHYNSGVKMHPNLHNKLRDEKNYTKPRAMNLNTEQKQALVAFLHTLTDDTFVKDKRYSNPFK